MHRNEFFPDDKVTYVGAKFAKDIGYKMGWVISAVANEPGVYCVEFGDDSFIMPESSLTRFKPTAGKEVGPEIRINRRRASEEE